MPKVSTSLPVALGRGMLEALLRVEAVDVGGSLEPCPSWLDTVHDGKGAK